MYSWTQFSTRKRKSCKSKFIIYLYTISQYNSSIGKLLFTWSRTTICVAKSPSIMSTCLSVKGNRQQNQPSVMAYKLVLFFLERNTDFNTDLKK
jgi:hypothetical protein